jgi:hypothetical protein
MHKQTLVDVPSGVDVISVPMLYLSFIKQRKEGPAISHMNLDYRQIILHAICAGRGHHRPPSGPSWDGRQLVHEYSMRTQH